MPPQQQDDAIKTSILPESHTLMLEPSTRRTWFSHQTVDLEASLPATYQQPRTPAAYHQQQTHALLLAASSASLSSAISDQDDKSADYTIRDYCSAGAKILIAAGVVVSIGFDI
ncbi:hypothetical protein LEL_07954 [Akanthomyces lecanii RCEF 1005]|uniref:Uncharacterized protein n=1 Tax=Akanthomyces lecanii RCEF 1005 TaxID=1081108 RepID=A0A168EXP2_CORDF|nr:hypothetical protein LEL_07954 [Akanthomyces lecanii RCEF 1005]